MKKFAQLPPTAKVEQHNPPCKMIDRLDYFYEEFDAENACSTIFQRLKEMVAAIVSFHV